MFRTNMLMAALVGLALAPAVARADTRAGVDAYLRGDFAEAVRIWRPLAIAGDVDAQYDLAQAYKQGRGVPVDPRMAESWYRKAADQGHRQARNAYGLTLFQGGNLRAAAPYLEEAAGHGFPQAQYVFATMLFNGDIVEKDWVRAYALMTRSSAGGVAAASTSLSQLDRYIPLEQRQRGLTLARAFETAGSKPDTSALDDTPAPKPQAIPRSVARPLPRTAVGNWRVQLGAFSDAGKASALWKALHVRITALAPYQSYTIAAGPLVRLQAGPLPARADANALCAAVRATGQPCIPVAP